MAIEDHIRNPIEWIMDQVATGAPAEDEAVRRHREESRHAPLPSIRRIEVADLLDVLAKGLRDVGANRTDILFLCLIYPVAGLILARAATTTGMLPLVFPLASGFALIGPVAAIGLYEISRRREAGEEINWTSAFGVLRSPAIGSIVTLGLLLLAIFLLWLAAAYAIFLVTLGPAAPASIGSFISDVFTTGAGWAMILVGCGVGFLFAVVALSIGVVSFPLLLDHDVGVSRAVQTSVRAVRENPVPMAAWGLIVAGGLVLGSIPALAGLIIVMPLLGHATWHLYRKVVAH